MALSNKGGFPHGIVAKADLSADNVDDILSFNAQFPNVKGIRFQFSLQV